MHVFVFLLISSLLELQEATVNVSEATRNPNEMGKNRTLLLDVSNNCPDVLYRVDHLDLFWVTSQPNSSSPANSWWKQRPAGICRMSFMTGEENHGLCVFVYDIGIETSDVKLKFFTSAFRPEKEYTKSHHLAGRWCTDQSLLTMELSTHRRLYDNEPSFSFSFEVRNRTKQNITKSYHMDSMSECDMIYTVPAETSVRLESQRVPAVDTLPRECELTFQTDSLHEYGQVCVKFDFFNLTADCSTELVVSELDDKYWTNITVYGCETVGEIEEICSKDKRLTLKLTRQSQNSLGDHFVLQIISKWHPHWEATEKLKSELRYLDAAKGFTVFIATLDTLIALSAAFITVSSRYPCGPLRYMADTFGQDPDPPHYAPGYPEVPVAIAGETEPPPF